MLLTMAWDMPAAAVRVAEHLIHKVQHLEVGRTGPSRGPGRRKESAPGQNETVDEH